MSSQGPNSPSTAADDASFGATAWSNPSNALVSDDSWATCKRTGGANNSHYLKLTNFGFSIPSGNTISGIQVSVEKHAQDAASVFDAVVSLVKGGSVTGNNKADAVTDWPLSDTVINYGGSSDLWGTTWLYSDINDSTFGIVISANIAHSTASVDVVTITVTYAAGGSDPGTTQAATIRLEPQPFSLFERARMIGYDLFRSLLGKGVAA